MFLCVSMCACVLVGRFVGKGVGVGVCVGVGLGVCVGVGVGVDHFLTVCHNLVMIICVGVFTELPVCDTEFGRCGTGEANGETQPWLTKTPATRHWPQWASWSRCACVHVT